MSETLLRLFLRKLVRVLNVWRAQVVGHAQDRWSAQDVCIA